MPVDIGYPNSHFGKNNWFYWVLYLLLPMPLIFIYLFILALFQPNLGFMEKIIFILGVGFFAFYIYRGLNILSFSLKTAKKLLATDAGIELVTYPGSTVRLDSASVIEEVTDRFSKKHHQLIFPIGCCVYRVVSDDKEYYLPIAKEHTFYLDKLKKGVGDK